MNPYKLNTNITTGALVALYILLIPIGDISAQTQIPDHTRGGTPTNVVTTTTIQTVSTASGTLTNVTISSIFQPILTPDELSKLRQAKIEVKNNPDFINATRVNIQAQQVFTEREFALLQEVDPSIEPILIKIKSNKPTTIAESNQLQTDSKLIENNPEYVDAVRLSHAALRAYLQKVDALILQNDPSMEPILTKLRQARDAYQ